MEWINDLSYLGVSSKVICDPGSILGMTVHAHGQGFYPAQHQETIHRSGYGSDCILQECQLFVQCYILANYCTTDDIRMTAQVLGG